MTHRFATAGGVREARIFATTMTLDQVDTTLGFTRMEGRAAPYDSWTTRWGFRETFAPGLFDKSIKEAARALPLLMFHDAKQWPIGHATEWSSRDDGLWGVWKLDGSADAQRAAQLAHDGHLPYLSVGYDPITSSWEMMSAEEWSLDDVTKLDKVTRHEARLVETSTVSTPAFADAEITLVRSGAAPGRNHTRPYLARWRSWRDSI